MQIQQITRKSLLYQSKVEYADFAINHVLGCSHGCRFPCYAMLRSIKYKITKDYEDWCRPKVVSNALELLDREIPRYQASLTKIKNVHLCFMTDPFPYDKTRGYDWNIGDLTIDIIEKLNVNKIKVTTLTKGCYPASFIKSGLQERVLLQENEYGITLVSMNPLFHEKFEPNSAPYDLRVKRLKDLHEMGCKTWVSMEPYPTPFLSDTAEDIEKVLNEIRFVDLIVFGRWNYNPDAFKKDGAQDFYIGMVKKVKKFCSKYGIRLHIKHGTPMPIRKAKED